MKINLLNLNKKDIKIYFLKLGIKIFHVHQLFYWIYKKNCYNLNKITNFSKILKRKLKSIFYILLPKVIKFKKSIDNTIKYVLLVNNNNLIETVFIPQKNRGTLCISTQVGCFVNCKFCYTGRNGFIRNLFVNEIIGQILLVNIELKKISFKFNFFKKITNIVLMGMGEPLLNFRNVYKFLEIILYKKFFNFKSKNITLSTIGMININKLFFNLPISLSISLHSSNDNLRNLLIPLNKKYSLKEIMEFCKLCIKNFNKKFLITFEYCMLNNVNDSILDAKNLVDLLKLNLSLKTKFYKLNLILFNNFNNSGFKSSNIINIIKFIKILKKNKILTTLRIRRGNDINASCGQLVSII